MKILKIWSFFWSVFSCIRTEFGYLLLKSSYSVQIQENMDQKKLDICTLLIQSMLPNCTLREVCINVRCPKYGSQIPGKSSGSWARGLTYGALHGVPSGGSISPIWYLNFFIEHLSQLLLSLRRDKLAYKAQKRKCLYNAYKQHLFSLS